MKILFKPFIWVAVWFLIFEEWLWDTLKSYGAALAKALHLQRVEWWIANTSPTVALITLVIPSIVITPFNLYALFMIAHGMVIQGIILEVVAKLVGTLLLSRIFALTKTQLLTFGWFNYCYTKIMLTLNWAHAKIKATNTYKVAVEFKQTVKQRVKQLWATI
jgi:hypothetical protein